MRKPVGGVGMFGFDPTKVQLRKTDSTKGSNDKKESLPPKSGTPPVPPFGTRPQLEDQTPETETDTDGKGKDKKGKDKKGKDKKGKDKKGKDKKEGETEGAPPTENEEKKVKKGLFKKDKKDKDNKKRSTLE